MAQLSFWRAAFRVARQDLRSSPRRALLAFLAVAIGTAAVSAARSVADAMSAKLQGNAREWIASDFYAALPQGLTPEEEDALQPLLRRGLQSTTVTEFRGMASSPDSPDASIAFFKVVDPRQYPFYGTITLDPNRPLTATLTPDSVAVSRDLLKKLGLKIGSSLRLGNAELHISAAIETEPDWAAGISSLLPRVLLSTEAFERSGVTLQGDVLHKLLFRVAESQFFAARAELEKTLPRASIFDYRDPDPNAASAFQQAASFLKITGWGMLAFGALALYVVLYLHIQSQSSSIAFMKALGGTNSRIGAIYMLRVVALVLGGTALGFLLAYPLGRQFLLLIENFFPIGLELQWSVRQLAELILVALVSSLPAVAAPLWNIRQIRALAIIRRPMEAVTPSQIGRRLPAPVKLGLRGLVRHRLQSASLLCALGFGTTLVVALTLCETQIQSKLMDSIPARDANLYIFSASPSQLDAASAWLSKNSPGSTMERFPLVWLDLRSVAGATPRPGTPGRWLSTCSREVPVGEISLSSDPRGFFQPGETLSLTAQRRSIEGRFSPVRLNYLGAMYSLLVLPCDAFRPLSVFYHAAATLPGANQQAVRRSLASAFPALPTLSGEEFTGLVGSTARNAIRMVQLLCWAVLGIAVGIEMLVITATKRTRQDEIAILRALGARKRTLVTAWVVEFGALGLLSGIAGSLTGVLLASGLLKILLGQTALILDLRIIGIAVLAMPILSAGGALAWLRSLLRTQPLEVLRDLDG